MGNTGTQDQPIGSSSLASITGINSKSTGSTLLYLVPSGRSVIITQAIVRCTAASSITNGPTVSVGVTSSAYSDIYLATNIAALTTTSNSFGFSSLGMFVQASSGSSIYTNVSVAASGTSQTIAIDLWGYLI